MVFELRFDPEAAKTLEKLPKDVSLRIYRKLEDSKTDPFRYFERLKGLKQFKLRVGSYRVIAEIVKNKLIILVLFIDHRKRIYK